MGVWATTLRQQRLLQTLLVLVTLQGLCPSDSESTCGWGVREACEPEFKGEWYGEFFPHIKKIPYAGTHSKDPLTFRYYNASEVICARGVCKSMKDWLRFSVAFWHTLRGDGSDPFGSPTRRMPWDDPKMDPMEAAFRRMHANFEFMDKLGVDLWCFHDRDIAPEGATLAETNENLDKVVEVALELQKGSSFRPLWGTAQLFKHPRYMHGAATSSNASVFAYAAAQVKKAIEVTQLLGGQNFVFWGGREGYQTLLNTDLKLEQANLARFMRLAVDYKKSTGFEGTFLIEPKPMEPTKHQYDWDAATSIGFLRQHGLEREFKLNIECNHATLSGHSCEHELQVASAAGMLGNMDANTGDPQLGWDTDQFLTDTREATLLMAVLLRQGGLGSGGINFDAKLRRESVSPLDLFYAHIGSMDALARGLRNAARMIEEGQLDVLVADRYSSWHEKDGLGEKIAQGQVGFKELEEYALNHPDPGNDMVSARAELAEILLSIHIQ